MNKIISMAVKFVSIISILLVVTHHQNNSVINDILINHDESNYKLLKNYGKLPLYFEQNEGQAVPEFKFLSKGFEYSLFLNSNEAVLSFNDRSKTEQLPEQKNDESRRKPSAYPDKLTANRLIMSHIAANEGAQISGLEKQRARSNYFIGNDPQFWHTNVPNYAGVKVENLYDGIDLVYYGHPGFLEFDYMVAPGADPRQIKIGLDGAEDYQIKENGDLTAKYGENDLILKAPHIYQSISDKRCTVEGQFKLSPDNELSFQIAAYDPTLPLIIDPQIVYSTFIGQGWGRAITVDNSGHAYITGITDDKSFPITPSAFQTELKEDRTNYADYDAIITKVNPDGTDLVYSTFLGGAVGNEEAFDIAVDKDGFVHVTGITYSHDFPTTPGAFKTLFNGPGNDNSTNEMCTLDAYVVKLDSSGSSLVYSTFLGGGSREYGYGIDLDEDGFAYATGMTFSEDFPTTSGAYMEDAPGGNTVFGSWDANENAYVSKLNLDGSSLLYSTYVGNPRDTLGRWYDDYATDIAVDKKGNAYITGHGILTGIDIYNIPTIFVAKLNKTGSSLLFSNQLGFGDSYGIDIDSKGNSYITGFTTSSNSSDFPITGNAFQSTPGTVPGDPFYGDAFLTKLDPSGSNILYSTYLGGRYREVGYDVAVDNSDLVYVVGFTASDNFPTKDAVQETFGGTNEYKSMGDAFVVKLDPSQSGDASCIYSTYLGGSSNDMFWVNFYSGDGCMEYPRSDEIIRGGGVAVDQYSNAYVVGSTNTTDFPLTVGAYDTLTLPSYFIKIFVTKIGTEIEKEPLIVDLVVNEEVAPSSRQWGSPQQTLPQYTLQAPGSFITFHYYGKPTDGKMGLRVFNTAVLTPSESPPLILSDSVKIWDPDTSEIIGNTIFNINPNNFGKQFDVVKEGWYTIRVMADPASTFPAPFQIHLAGDVGHPNDNINYDRGTRLDILFNHTAPRPQGIFVPQGLGAQNALFKFGNPAILSPYALAVMVPQLASGFTLNTAIIRAPDPWDPLSITTPTARTPLCGGGDLIGRVIDFTQVPDPAVIPANLDGSICGVIGDHIGSSYTFSSALILDMGSGQEIVNGEGDDFKIYAPSGNYSVAVSNTPYAGTFLSIGGVVAGTQSFDLASTGLTSARFVLISAAPQVALDAVKALNVFVDGSVTDPITGTQIWVGDVGYATMTMRRAKAPVTNIDPFLELIAPNGEWNGDNESGFGDKTSLDLSDAALVNKGLSQSGFYRFLARGYHQLPGDQSSGAFFVRLESGGDFDVSDVVVSPNDENDLLPQKIGSIKQLRERDSYIFQAQPGQSINIVVNSKDSKLDPVLELYDPEDFLITANDNFPGRGKNPVLQVNLPQNSFNGNEALPNPSTYRVVVSAIDVAGVKTPLDDELNVYQRTVSGGNYELKIFTGALAGVEPIIPSIASCSPNGAIQGASNIELIIKGTDFANGATVSFNNSGIVVQSVEFISTNEMKVIVTISQTASLGWFDLTITNPDGGEKTEPDYFEVRTSFGSVNLTWDPPSSSGDLAPPENLSLQFNQARSFEQQQKYLKNQTRTVFRVRPIEPNFRFRLEKTTLNLFDIIDEVEPNNSFAEAQVVQGDSFIFIDGRAEVQDQGNFVLTYQDAEDDIEDWYKCTTQDSGLYIELWDITSDCDLILFSSPDVNGFVDLSNTIGDTVEEFIDQPDIPAGTYYVGVSIYDPDPMGPDTTYYALDFYGDFSSGGTNAVVSYNVYRSTSPNAHDNGVLVGNVSASEQTFQDTPPSKQMYYYQVTAVYGQGESVPSNEASVGVSGIEETDPDNLPNQFVLYQNYPNPFNPSTTISFELPHSTAVLLEIYDTIGKKIRTVLDEVKSAGHHSVVWDSRDEAGELVPSGIYIYRLKTESFVTSRKLMLLK